MSRELRRTYKRHVEGVQNNLRRSGIIDSTLFSWVQSLGLNKLNTETTNITSECITNYIKQSSWQGYVINSDVAIAATMGKDFAECLGDTNTATWAAAVAAIALYETRGMKHEYTSVPPKDKFTADICKVCRHLFGKTFKEVFHEELHPCFDEALLEINLTEGLLREITNFYYEVFPNDILADLYAEPMKMWEWAVTAYIARSMYLGEVNKRLHALLEKRERAPRAPTKKQSEVIADLKDKLRQERESCKAAQDKLRADMQAMAHEHNQQVAQLERERDALQERLDYYTQRPEEVELDSLLVACESELPELPEKDVVIIGGRGQLHGRLLERYPGWTCVPLDIESFNVSPGKLVFQLIDCTTHKQTYRLESLLGRKGFYKVTGTGVDAILRCMRYRLLNEK